MTFSAQGQGSAIVAHDPCHQPVPAIAATDVLVKEDVEDREEVTLERSSQGVLFFPVHWELA